MSHPPNRSLEPELVAAQTGRVPRTPWRTASRCRFGYPTVIVSPARLDDGTPFPNFAWLTCPWLSERASAQESVGGAARWARRAADDSALASRLEDLDSAVRAARRSESGGEDACAAVGIAGQRDPLGVKCLHAHTALALLGFEDPIGEELLQAGRECPDGRCAHLLKEGSSHE